MAQPEYLVEIWKLAAGAEGPLVLGGHDVLRWTPMPGGEALDAPLESVFGQGAYSGTAQSPRH